MGNIPNNIIIIPDSIEVRLGGANKRHYHERGMEILQKYYDVETLRAWIAEYEHATGKRQQDQVVRWRRVLWELENVEPHPPNTETSKTMTMRKDFDDYAQLA